jgi:hypothetical protein
MTSVVNKVAGLFYPSAAMATNFRSGSWDCGDIAEWDASSILVDPYTHLEVAQTVIPLHSEDSDSVTPMKDQVTQAALEVKAAKLPFGLYQFVNMSEFGFRTSTWDADKLSPFPIVAVPEFDGVFSTGPGSYGYLDVFPLVKNMATGEVWKGAGGPSSAYELVISGPPSFLLASFGGPGTYTFALVLKCKYTNCGTLKNGTSLVNNSYTCFTAELDLKNGTTPGLVSDSTGGGWVWVAPLSPAATSPWTAHTTATPGILPASCSALFFD